MPKIYSDETMKLVWDMVKIENLKRREISAQLDTTPEVIDRIYNAASKRYSKGARSRYIEKPEEILDIKFTRVKGEYSNKSPMGIASDYLLSQ